MRPLSHRSSKSSLADFLSSGIHRNIDRMNWRKSSLFLPSRFSSWIFHEMLCKWLEIRDSLFIEVVCGSWRGGRGGAGEVWWVELMFIGLILYASAVRIVFVVLPWLLERGDVEGKKLKWWKKEGNGEVGCKWEIGTSYRCIIVGTFLT